MDVRRLFTVIVQEMLHAGFDQSWKRRGFAAVLGLVCFLFPFGIVFIVGGVLPEEFAWTASVIITLTAAATFMSEVRNASFIVILRNFLFITITLFAIEFVGVNTGFPFGAYSYTEVLGFSFLGVPVAISFAWYATIVNSWRIAEVLMERPGAKKILSAVLLAGVLTLNLDIALEPMASDIKRYWIWQGGEAPIQNYVSWLVLSLAGVYFLMKTQRSPGDARAGLFTVGIILYSMQLVLFTLADLVHGHIIPAVVAVIAFVSILWIGIPGKVRSVQEGRVRNEN